MHHPACDGWGYERHHKKERRNGGTDDLDNLMWVNPNCHTPRIHRYRNLARHLGYLIDNRPVDETAALKDLQYLQQQQQDNQ